MALQKELLVRLNNEEEPLPKRLRLAKNVFQTTEFPIQRKESIIFNWFCNNQIPETEIWPTFSECVTSEKMIHLNVNDFDNELKSSIIKMMLKQLENESQPENMKNDIIHACICVCNNESMHYFFKISLDEYSKFISTLLLKISTTEHAEQILDSIFMFQKKILDKTLYYDMFIKLIPSLSKLIVHFKNEVHIFQEVSKLVKKVLFSYNLLENYKTSLSNTFSKKNIDPEEMNKNIDPEEMNKNIDPEEMNMLLKKILLMLHDIHITFEKNEILTTYKLIFHSFLNSYNSQASMVFQLFVLLNSTIGFKFDDLYLISHVPKIDEIDTELSLLIINEFLKMMSTLQVNDMTIGECTLNTYIENLVTKIIKKTKIPFLISFNVFCNMITLDPIAVENKLNELIIHIVLNHKESVSFQNEYTTFMKCLLEMFSKLHREQKFISKFLKCLNSILSRDSENNIFNESSSLKKIIKKLDLSSIQISDILTPAVCTYFGNLFENFSNSQSVTMLRTLNFQLNNDIVKVIEPSKCDSLQILLTQIEIEITIIFLNNVTIAEHTVPSLAFENFISAMDELKHILAEFGKKLLYMEHNCNLMAAYLNLCYVWGELSVLILHYSPSGNSSVSLVVSNDVSARNFTYLHSYLTADQWNSISQRINNFGENKCKKLMHKFLLQKIRAMLLFNLKISNEAKISYNKSLMDNIEETKSLIITEDVSIDYIFPMLSTAQLVILAESFVDEVIETNNYHLLLKPDFQERRKFILANIVVCMKKLTTIFKIKRKHSTLNVIPTPLTKTVLLGVDSILFTEENEEYLESEINNISKHFCELIQDNNTLKINFDALNNYLNFFSHLPVSYCSKYVKTIMFFVLYALRIDLKSTNQEQTSIAIECENLLIDILEGDNPPNMMSYISHNVFYGSVTEFENWRGIISFLIENNLKNEETVSKLKYGLKYIQANINTQLRCLQIVTVIFKSVLKVKKSLKNPETKTILNKYKHKCTKILIKLLESKHKYLPKNMLEFYGLVLQNCFIDKSKKYIDKLLSHLNIFVDYALSEKNPSDITWKFLEVLLRKKHDLKKHLPSTFVLKCQKICKNSPAPIIALIFETANNQQFSKLLDDLLKTTKKAWITNNEGQFEKKLNVWSSIIKSSLNMNKQAKRQCTLGKLLSEMLLYMEQNPANNIHFCKTILNLASELAESKNIVLSGSLIDTLLIIISHVDLNSVNMDTYIELSTSTLLVLDLLFAYRNAMMLDKLPPFLTRFRYLLNSLCLRSNVNEKLTPENISLLANIAHGIEKLVLKMAGHRKDLIRLAPYLIADFLHYYETITFYLPIKNHLNNCLFALINICDTHAIPFLNRALSAASKELFKKSYDEYRKYYRFVGKI